MASEWGEWKDVVLQNLAAPTRNALVGGPFGSELLSSDQTAFGVPVIRGENLSAGRWVGGDFVFVSEAKARQLAANIAGPLDIVFTQRGANHYRQVALVPADADGRFVVSQSQMKLTADPEKADPLFIYYMFRAPAQQEYLQRNAIQTGVPHTNLSILRNTPLRIPPLAGQRAIAHILGTLDDKIELNRRTSETLEATARTLFKSWFVDFDPVRAKSEGRDSGLPPHLADLFPESFEDSELGEIPKGWEVGGLASVADNPRRQVDPRMVDGSTPYIGLEHMPRKRIALDDWGTAADLDSDKFQFRRGDILFGKLRPYFHKVGIAPVDGVCSTDILVIKPKSSVGFGFVLGLVSSEAFVSHASAGSTGTRMPRTSWRDMARYGCAIPPDPILAAFTDHATPVIDRLLVSTRQARVLGELRDAMLPRLLSGNLTPRPVTEHQVST